MVSIQLNTIQTFTNYLQSAHVKLYQKSNLVKAVSGNSMSLNNIKTNHNMMSSAFMLLAMASYAIGDAIVKLISSEMPLGQILFTRGLFAVILLFIITHKKQQLRPFSTILKKPFALRIFGEIFASYFFLTALFQMPIANAAAIMQALPLTITLATAYFFKETIGWRRMVAILIGLLGVILIIQPGLDGFNIFSLYCLLAVIGCTIRDVATRGLSKDTPTIFVTLVTVIVITLFGGLLGFTEKWTPPTLYSTSILFVASIVLSIGFIAIISSMRIGEVAVVTPFRYSILIFAILIGAFLFNEIPNILTIMGSIIVVGSGIYTIYREHMANKKLEKFSLAS